MCWMHPDPCLTKSTLALPTASSSWYIKLPIVSTICNWEFRKGFLRLNFPMSTRLGREDNVRTECLNSTGREEWWSWLSTPFHYWTHTPIPFVTFSPGGDGRGQAPLPRTFQSFGVARLLYTWPRQRTMKWLQVAVKVFWEGREASMGQWFSSLMLQCLETFVIFING